MAGFPTSSGEMGHAGYTPLWKPHILSVREPSLGNKTKQASLAPGSELMLSDYLSND